MTAGMLRCVRCVSVVAIGLFAARPAHADSLNLAWDPNTDTVSGYAVYVGVQSGTYTSRFDVGGATAFTYSTATAGTQYCFTVAAYTTAGESAKSSEVCGYSNRYPVLTNPGNQSSTVGQPVSLQLQGSDPDGQPVTYTASGLPAGVSLMASTGFVSGTGTTAGTFSVTARVSDGVLSSSNQTFTWTMAAAPTQPPPDTTLPLISIASPTSNSSYTSSMASITLGGTSSDNVGVTQVSWTNSLGGAGTASGTTSWNSGAIALVAGTNVITVSARDAAGNVGIDTVSVSYTVTAPPPPPPSSVVLSGQLVPTKWRRIAQLSWTTAPWSYVYVYRNGVKLTRTSNDGSFSDSLRYSGSYTYKICDTRSTACSNTVTLYY
jgi:putative Ig domain-containing protein/fibronectin type III domain protein